jgi:hypothetical protein
MSVRGEGLGVDDARRVAITSAALPGDARDVAAVLERLVFP